ncbi:inositol monophosphatase family protein [Gephyromycinifex aptenodytis]|uniref:inositol monophosphatase family protein n=1 Tax=Gephyromycinifex aptenodytis TaxID=2716227 RepID=UPI001D01315E|nr:inositol monophosphatase family protein [Gephyromycinifex aptenodytis]
MDTDAVLELMREVAEQVINPRFRSLEAGQIMEKSPGDLVTVADREAEELITAALLADDPSVLIVGEEATAADPGLLDRLADAEHAYTVDPVDGTKNFVNGSPDHAVMIAELRHGEPVRAWILQPAHDLTFVSEKGAGVYRNGEPLPMLTPVTDAAELRIATSRPRLEGQHGEVNVRGTYWSCGIDYPWLAQGGVDALHYTRALPWDHAPGLLLLSELGGVVACADGTPYHPARHHEGCAGLLAASAPQTWELAASHLRDVLR